MHTKLQTKHFQEREHLEDTDADDSIALTKQFENTNRSEEAILTVAVK